MFPQWLNRQGYLSPNLPAWKTQGTRNRARDGWGSEAATMRVAGSSRCPDSEEDGQRPESKAGESWAAAWGTLGWTQVCLAPQLNRFRPQWRQGGGKQWQTGHRKEVRACCARAGQPWRCTPTSAMLGSWCAWVKTQMIAKTGSAPCSRR